MKRYLVIGALLFFASAAMAQTDVYRWVDAQGRVQYSDQAPSGVKAEKITSKSASGASAAAGTKGYKEQDQDFRKRRVEEEEKAKKDATAEQQTKVKQQHCNQARAHLATLQAGGRIARVNEKGEREFLDDKNIEAASAEAKKAIAESCK